MLRSIRKSGTACLKPFPCRVIPIPLPERAGVHKTVDSHRSFELWWLFLYFSCYVAIWNRTDIQIGICKTGENAFEKVLVFDSAIYTLLLFTLVFLKDSRREINFVPVTFVKEYIVNNKPLGLTNIVGNVGAFSRNQYSILALNINSFLSFTEKKPAEIPQ